MADALRGSMDAAEYKHVVLGLIFLKYISDAFQEMREFYTPRCVVKLLVEMLEPYQGRVYDPCCGSSGMFVQSMEFIDAHTTGNGNGGKARGDISIWGQESNYTTWRLAKMNLALRGIEGNIAHGDSFHDDRHPDLKADYILANPPFNVSDWGGERLRDEAMGVRRPVYGQRQLRLGAAHGPPPVTPRQCRLRPGQRLHVVQPADRLTFKDAFRHAAKHDLISVEACEGWFAYRDNRNDTAHDYGEKFAETTLKLLPDFITDARELARIIAEGEDD